MAMIVAAIAVVATGWIGWIALVLALCHSMAPKTPEERRYSDDAQMAALANYTRGLVAESPTPSTAEQATGYIEPDPAPVGGVERPVLHRAMPS